MLLLEIKKMWISFLKSKGYFELEDFSLVPKNDDSILWVNSGVSAIKKYFKNPSLSPARNMVNSQRVIRTNDIDLIDENSYHQTLFEMLGSFSINGNFKSEVIPIVWDFLTDSNYLKIASQKLFITTFKGDKDTIEIWNKQKNINLKNIILCNEDSNFWDMGEGPCGPNTEIYYCFDLEKINQDKSSEINVESKNFIEVGNLVFSDKYHKGIDYLPLDEKCVDIGIGLERLAVVTQFVSNSFEIDIWIKPLALLESKYLKIGFEAGKNKAKSNIIIDHFRTFIIAVFDGILPEPKHRGYVIKKLIKKAALISYLLGLNVNDLVELTLVIIQSNSQFIGLIDKSYYIVEIVERELNKLYSTFDLYKNYIQKYLKDEQNFDFIVPAKSIFFWYDTKGIPIELIENVLKDSSFIFDKDNFKIFLDKQKKMGSIDRFKKDISVF
jgi:alanyl-tRNA synthetase